MPFTFPHPSRICLYLVPLFVLAGCGREPEIRQYTVKKYESPQKSPPTTAKTAASAGPARMLGAMTALGETLWFYKLTGPPAAVATRADAVKQWLPQITYGEDGTPRWTLPEGWEQRPGNEFRFATVVIPVADGPPLELSVSKLPKASNDWELPNVNRWRGQLSLPPWSATELTAETTRLPFTGGEYLWLDFAGQSSGGPPMMGQRPTASAAAPTAGPPIAAPPAGAPAKVRYTVPAEWTEKPASGFRKAAFDVVDGEQRAEVTVSNLARGANDLWANLRRWRGQVGLPDVTDDELKSQVVTIPAGSLSATVIQVTGQNEKGEPSAILGAVLEEGDQMWFVKFTGPPPLATRERERFEAFVQSLSFDEPPPR